MNKLVFVTVAIVLSSSLAAPTGNDADKVVPEATLSQHHKKHHHHDGPVYAKNVVTYGTPQFKEYQHKCICPVAATHMAGCVRCEDKSAGKHGGCAEYLKFNSHADFKKYTTYHWAKPWHWARYLKSGSSGSGFKTISHKTYEKKLKDLSCFQVRPNPDPTPDIICKEEHFGDFDHTKHGKTDKDGTMSAF